MLKKNQKKPRAIKRTIHFAVMKAIENGYTRFIAAPEYGAGLWAAESVLAIRRVIPFIELEIVEAPDTESEGELDEFEFDRLLERKERVSRWAKSCYLVCDDSIECSREILDSVRPGLLLLFGGKDDEALFEPARYAEGKGCKVEWHRH